MFLARFAKYHYENRTLYDIIHHDLWNQIFPGSLRKYLKTAYSCLKEDRVQRPNMLNVVDELEKALEEALRFDELEKLEKALKFQLRHDIFVRQALNFQLRHEYFVRPSLLFFFIFFVN
ncbi:hypothetical protein HanRHA438_Chr11g0518951 [Helianthus annuus]|nr:hypothetical protein HanHA300_Chr11g0415301 [Helianthus annuus]KAJ0518609.1 hypothetical protein HanHA89_Chr11g0439351 [Helianthus annuus]KAJ0686649.1 hypothetical protein HanLR1_Chr11g0417081 [Helianthus annuus]KAJ0690466.1 hypothetical protein HanOQP8_Chr11g0418111 [Helianthus annuus]KAJ0872014.1 hypothetical protein HanRHA438_Chr11g0518951 [Helianthus annuus]